MNNPQHGVPQVEEKIATTSSQRVPITASSWLDMRLAGDIAIAPDGKQVAFEVSARPPGQDAMRTRIWIR